MWCVRVLTMGSLVGALIPYVSSLCGNISSGCWGWVCCADEGAAKRGRDRNGRRCWRSERRVRGTLGLLLHPGDIIWGTRDASVGEPRQTEVTRALKGSRGAFFQAPS